MPDKETSYSIEKSLEVVNDYIIIYSLSDSLEADPQDHVEDEQQPSTQHSEHFSLYSLSESLTAEDCVENQVKRLENACQADSKEIQELFVNNFLNLLSVVDFEYGFTTAADDFVKDALSRYGTFAREWINILFMENFDNQKTTSSILRVLAHLDYDEIYPQGVTMATAAINNRDIEVQECAIRCFESWENVGSVRVLRQANIQESWLEEYRQAVISDLERM